MRKSSTDDVSSMTTLSRRDRRAGRRVPPGLRLERWHRAVMQRRWIALVFALAVGTLFVIDSAALGPAVQAVTGRPALLLLFLAAVLLAVDHAVDRIHLRHDHVERR